MLLRTAAITTLGLCWVLGPLAAIGGESGEIKLRQPSDVAGPVDAESLQRQFNALSAMPSVGVSYAPHGPIRTINGQTGIALSRATRDLPFKAEAPEILSKLRDVLLANGTETLRIRVNIPDGRDRTIKADQFINGIPVLYGGVSLGVEDATGLINHVTARFLPDRGLPHKPKISDAVASELAIRYVNDRKLAKSGSVRAYNPSLAYRGGGTRDPEPAGLIWVVATAYSKISDGSLNEVNLWVDAITGEIVGSEPVGVESSAQVYTANHVELDTKGFPSGLTWLFDHPGSSADPIVMNIYNNFIDSVDAVLTVGGFLYQVPIRLVSHYGNGLAHAG